MLNRIIFTEVDLCPNIRRILNRGEALAVDKSIQNALSDLNAKSGMAIFFERTISPKSTFIAVHSIPSFIIGLGVGSFAFAGQLNLFFRPRISFVIVRKGENPLDILVGMTVPFGNRFNLSTMKQIPVLVFVMIGIRAFRRVDTDDEPTTAKRNLTI